MGNDWNDFEKGENGEKIDHNGRIFTGNQTMVKDSSRVQTIDFVKKKIYFGKFYELLWILQKICSDCENMKSNY